MASVAEAAPPYTATKASAHHHDGYGHSTSSKTSPPTYAPYPTSLPDKFPVGRNKTTPVVSIDQVQAHLTILGAFHALRRLVREAGADDPDAAWAIFLARAVHRFQTWAPCVRFTGNDLVPMPPLDVLMVWHSYLLVSPNNQQALYHSLRRKNPRIHGYITKTGYGCSQACLLSHRSRCSTTPQQYPPLHHFQRSRTVSINLLGRLERTYCTNIV